MTLYHVHLFREMRLVFGGIEAESLERAAEIARDLPTAQADEIDDCDGDTFAALVDVAGDEEHLQSRIVDFEPERLRTTAPALLEALTAIQLALCHYSYWQKRMTDHLLALAEESLTEARAA